MKSVSIFWLWAIIFTILSHGGTFLLRYFFGVQTPTIFAAVGLTAILAAFVGYMAASANNPDYKKKWHLIFVGAGVILVSGMFTSLMVYFFNAKFDLPVGYIQIAMGAVGGYLAERKKHIR